MKYLAMLDIDMLEICLKSGCRCYVLLLSSTCLVSRICLYFLVHQENQGSG